MEDIKFDNMNVYLNLAKKIINKFAGSLSKEMLKSEDAISDAFARDGGIKKTTRHPAVQ